jgi:uncharacterized membrane protein YoaK (UPF0700 family)
MTKLERRARVFACLLAALAGFTDATGFILTGGFFVSFMSGNSTRLGVGLADALGNAVIACGIILTFLAGVIGGALLGHASKGRRALWVLLLMAALLAAAAAAAAITPLALTIGLIAVAMGAENAVFELEGEVQVGVTYMTGSLVKLGSGIAAALLGRKNGGWANYLLLWLGFVSGATLGAAGYNLIGAATLWVASAIALLLAILSRRFLQH